MPTALETQTERGLGNYCITVRVFIVMWCLIKKQKHIYIYNYYIMIPRPDLDLYATNSKVTAQLYSAVLQNTTATITLFLFIHFRSFFYCCLFTNEQHVQHTVNQLDKTGCVHLRSHLSRTLQQWTSTETNQSTKRTPWLYKTKAKQSFVFMWRLFWGWNFWKMLVYNISKQLLFKESTWRGVTRHASVTGATIYICQWARTLLDKHHVGRTLKITFLSNIVIWCYFWNPFVGWIGLYGGLCLAHEPPVDDYWSVAKFLLF